MNVDQITHELDNLSIADSVKCIPEDCQNLIGLHDNHLRIIHINIRSLKKNFDQFAVMLSVTKIEFDFIVLTECWLQVSGNLPILQGYTSYSTANNLKQNDGVVIYAKHSINCHTYEPTILDANCLVSCFNNVAIIALYRSPSYRDTDNFYSSLKQIVTSLKSNNNIVLVGDINIDIKPGTLDHNSEDYLNLTASLDLCPAHTLPTRLGNCLDHFLIKTQCNAKVMVLDTHITDHLPIVLSISLKNKPNTPLVPTTSVKYDFESIKNEIDTTDYRPILDTSDADRATDLLISNLQSVITKHSKTVRTPNRKIVIKPWLTAGLLRCLRNRDKMHRQVTKSPDNLILKKTYTRYRNFCNSLIKKLKRAYEKTEFLKAKNNPKKTWKVIKSITHSNILKQPCNNLLKSSKDTVDSLNNINHFFVDVGKNLASKFSPGNNSPPSVNSPVNSLSIPPVEETEVLNIIQNLRSDCAIGWDNIPAKILKLCSSSLVPIITHICNCAINSGTFPKALKRAVVHPIYKAGAKDDVSNYRPISVLCSLSKILERILNSNLTKFLAKNNLIANNQYGFRSGISTEDAVNDFTNSLVDKLDNGLRCYGIFLDLTKAFDSVSVPRLVAKLECMGVRGLALNIFKSYLSDRCQCVRVNGLSSNEKFLDYGIPQGSILGPTLFQIYINDLCLLSLNHCDIFTYADDTALLIYDKDWTKAKINAERSLQCVMDWLAMNLLTLNTSKTKVLQFLPPNVPKPPSDSKTIIAHVCQGNLQCDCVSLALVPSIKYLGVHIDDRLDWRVHTEAICTRLRKLMYLIKELRHSADRETSSLVYRSLCESIINYCIPIWGGTFKTTMLKVERAQRAVLKVMLFHKRDYSTTRLYKEAQVLSVRQLYILRTTLRRHLELPFDAQVTRRRTAFPVCKIIRCRSALARRHFLAQSAHIYNKINKKLKIYPMTFYKVKQSLKSWLQSLTYDETEQILTHIS